MPLDKEINPHRGAGSDFRGLSVAADDVLRFWYASEAFPRMVIKPSTGQVLTGNGTVYPATPLGSGGGLPAGGTTDQAIVKASNADFDFTFADVIIGSAASESFAIAMAVAL